MNEFNLLKIQNPIKKEKSTKAKGGSNTKRTLFFVSPIYKRRVYEKCH